MTVAVTGHHLILSLAEGAPGRDSGHRELWLLHSNLAAVQKTEEGRSGSIMLRCTSARHTALIHTSHSG